MIKAIFFDVDGTLVSFKTHRMPASTLEALNRLREKGIKLFIATGRHRESIRNVGGFSFDGYVTLNGGVCYVGDEVIYRRSIDNADVRIFVEYLKTEEELSCVFVREEGTFVNYADEAMLGVLELLDLETPPAVTLDEMLDNEVFQILSFFREEQEQRIMSMLPNCEAMRWTPLFADLVPKGGNKWVGISEVIKRFGIERHETMAFGDGGNDIEMIQGAAIGVAMGDSEKNVQKASDFVTLSVDDDGIKHALSHFELI